MTGPLTFSSWLLHLKVLGVMWSLDVVQKVFEDVVSREFGWESKNFLYLRKSHMILTDSVTYELQKTTPFTPLWNGM